MYKLFFIAKNNIRKQKGEMVTFAVLTCLTALLLFIGMSMISGMKDITETAHERISGADVQMNVTLNPDSDAAVRNILKKNENVGEFEADYCYLAEMEYKNKKDSEWSNLEFVITPYHSQRRIQTMSVDASGLSGNEIVLPYYLKNSFPVGDTFCFRKDGKVLEYTVAGYNEDTVFNNPLNFSVYLVFVSDEEYEKIGALNPETVFPYVRYKAWLSEEAKQAGISDSDLETEIEDAFTDWAVAYAATHPDYKMQIPTVINATMMKEGGMITPRIAMLAVVIFSMIILIITLIIVSFSIKNFIQRNMKNTGIMEASGYTVREIRRAMLLQLMMVTLFGIVLGLILGAVLTAPVGDLVGSMIGLSWNQPVNVPAMFIVSGALLLVVFAVVWLQGRRYQKITVLDALRGGMTTHNFRKNTFPLEKTRLPKALVLSLKETFGRMGNTIAITLIAVVLAFVTVVGFATYQLFGNSNDTTMEILGFEVGDIEADAPAAALEDLKKVEGVTNIVCGRNINITVESASGRSKIKAKAYEDTGALQRCKASEGRLPIHANEVALTSVTMKKLQVEIGDTVEISLGENKASYIITGKYQLMQAMGKTAILTFDGARRIYPTEFGTVSYIITTEPGISYEEMCSRLDAACPGIRMQDGEKLIAESADTITSSMTMLCMLIVIVTTVTVIFVETMLIRSKLVREWNNLGVNRALGFTNRDLMHQIMLSNVPALAVGSLLGVILGSLLAANVMQMMLGMFGYEKLTFSIDLLYPVVTFAGILLVAVLVSALNALKVRKLNPVEMITEE